MGNVIKAIKSKHYLQQLIEQGEHEHQDFKFQISDARKIARSISAFANNDGGRLLVGVKDNGNIAGIESDEEIYMIEQAATTYCRPAQQVQFSLYRIEGRNVLKVDIAPASQRPVKAQDDDRQWRAYYRVADENLLAHPLHVRLWQLLGGGTEAALQYGQPEQVLMEHARAHGHATIEEYARVARISLRAAEQSALELCRMGMLAPAYLNGQFVLRAQENAMP